MMKKFVNDEVYMSIHIDDILIIGKKEHRQQVIKDFKNSGFDLSITENSKDYLSCEITPDKYGNSVYIYQPRLIKKKN